MIQVLANNSALLCQARPGDNGRDSGASNAVCIFMLLTVIVESIFLWNQPNADYKLLVLLINLLLFALLAVYDTPLGFKTAIMLLPFDAILPSYKVAGLVAIDLYVEAILVLAVICLLKVVLGQLKYRFSSLDLIVLSFALIALTFLFTSSDIHRSGYCYFHIVGVPTLTYFIVRVVLNSEAEYRSFRTHLLFSITVMAAAVVVIFAVTRQRVDLFRGLESGTLFTLAIFLLWSARKERFLSLSVVNFAGLLFCFPRALLFCLFCSPVICLIVKKGLGRVFFLIVIIFSLLGTIWLQTVVTDSDYRESGRELDKKQRYSTSIDTIEKSSTRLTDMDFFKNSIYGRVGLWKADLPNFYAQPLFGAGVGMTNTKTASSHNVHVQLLSSVGLVGYLVFHLLLLQSLGYKSVRAGGMLHRDLLFYSTIVFIAYIDGLTNGLMHGLFNYTLFPVMALICNLRFFTSTEHTQPGGI